MVGLARQLKERSLMISQSVENTEKVRCYFFPHNLTLPLLLLLSLTRGIREESMLVLSYIDFHGFNGLKQIFFTFCCGTHQLKDTRLYWGGHWAELSEHGTRKCKGVKDILREFKDELLPVAIDLGHDLCLHYGCLVDPCHIEHMLPSVNQDFKEHIFSLFYYNIYS